MYSGIHLGMSPLPLKLIFSYRICLRDIFGEHLRNSLDLLNDNDNLLSTLIPQNGLLSRYTSDVIFTFNFLSFLRSFGMYPLMRGKCVNMCLILPLGILEDFFNHPGSILTGCYGGVGKIPAISDGITPQQIMDN